MPPALQHLTFWQWVEPPVLIVTVALEALFLLTVRGPWRRRFRDAGTISGLQTFYFMTGLGLLYAAFGGPLDILADGYLFSAHMTQHMIEAFISAPLLLMGTPAWLVRPVYRWRPGGAVMRTVTRPLIGMTLFMAVMGLTIWPQFYNLMELSPIVHFCYHAALLMTALASWWPLLSPLPELPRQHPGMQMLYITISGLPMLALFAPLALDTAPYYSYYAHVPRVFGLSQVADQQIGAIVMLAGAHVPVTMAFLGAFRQWVHREKVGVIDPRPSVPGPPVVRIPPAGDRAAAVGDDAAP
jgi:putative membrane protein